MNKAILVLVILLVGLGAYWLFRMLFPPDEVVIRRTLREAAQAVSARPEGGGLEKLAAINRLLNLCTADIMISLDAPEMRARVIQGTDQLREAAAALLGAAENLEVRLMDIGVVVAPDRVQAVAQFIARARADGAQEELIQEFRVTLNRSEGPWKIHRVEPLRSLVFPRTSD